MSTAREGIGTQIVVATFGGTDTAQHALDTLQRLQREGWVETMDATMLIRDQGGRVSIRGTQEVDPRRGALAGALVGLLAGPVGAAAGAIAGAAGAGVG